MNERKLQLRIGLMVLATVIVTATLLVMFGEGPEMFQPHYTIQIKVPEAQGASVKTAIRKRGILIGRITRVDLLENGVLITARISANRKIYRNEVCRIYPSVIGDADVNFALPPGVKPSDEFISHGDVVEGVVARDPMQLIGDLQGDFAQVIRSVASTSEETRNVMRKLGDLFDRNEDRIDSIATKAEANMDVIRETLTNTNDVIGDPELRAKLKETVREFPELMGEARKSLKKINQMVDSADRNLRNVETFTLALSEQGTDALERLDEGAAKLRFVMDQMAIFSENLNRSDTTIGLLMHERQLYDNLNQAVANIEHLSRQLRPVVNDARVFTDKIARHPELLGVRGAMQRNAGTKGVPPAFPIR